MKKDDGNTRRSRSGSVLMFGSARDHVEQRQAPMLKKESTNTEVQVDLEIDCDVHIPQQAQDGDQRPPEETGNLLHLDPEMDSTKDDQDGDTSLEKSKVNPLGGPYTQREYTFLIIVGSIMAFNSGCVNGSCLSGFISPTGTQQATSSFTGTTTMSALELGDGNIDSFGFFIGMVLSFMFGALLSGILTPNPTPFQIEPTYGPTFLIGASFLIVSSILAALKTNEDLVFYLAAAANGIQNGISSIYSGNLIRSTGYSGTVTDIGVYLAQKCQGNPENTWKLYVLIMLLVSFWTGGIVSFFLARHFTTYALLFNAAVFIIIGGSLVAFLTYELGISIKEALLGTWKWQKAFESLETAFADTSVFMSRRGGLGISTTSDRGNSSCDIGGTLSDRQLNRIFSKVDTDHSNSIDQDELKEALRWAGMNLSDQECAVMMKHADTDGNGTLSRDEWIQVFRACQTKRYRGGFSLLLFRKQSSSSVTNKIDGHGSKSSLVGASSDFRDANADGRGSKSTLVVLPSELSEAGVYDRGSKSPVVRLSSDISEASA